MTLKEYNKAIDLWADDIFSFAMYCCNDKERCNDAMQEAFASLWERHDSIELDKCKGFLLTVTQRKIIDSIRHDKRSVSLNEVQDNTPTTSPLDNIDTSDTINIALQQLSEQQRIILTLHDIEGYSYKEIAQMQKMNYSQVQVTAFRARIRLKKALQSLQSL